VGGAGINKVGESQLFNSSQALKRACLDHTPKHLLDSVSWNSMRL
jgi:hypothetical protein